MQYKIFTIPATMPSDQESELNAFLKTVKVAQTRWEFVPNGDTSFWTVLVSYSEKQKSETVRGKSKVDYQVRLSPKDFALFTKLREWRNATAEKEKVPPYTMFNNKHIADMAEKRVRTLGELEKIEGVGNVRAEKYGETILEIIRRHEATEKKTDETAGQSVSPDTGMGQPGRGVFESGQGKTASKRGDGLSKPS